MRTVINDAEYADVIALAAHAAHKLPGVLGKCMSLSILLEISFDRISVYSLFCMSIFPQTYIYIYIHIYIYIYIYHLHTGAHGVSVFFGQRKISVWDRVEKSPQEALSLLNGE